MRWFSSHISGSKGISIFDEISLSGEKAIKLLMSDGFPSDNRFGLRFYDGNEAGEDELIASFDGGHICSPTRRYPFSWLRKPDAELIITSKSAELETFLASLSTLFENRMNSVNMRLRAMGCPVAVNTTTLEDREFVLRLTEGRGVPSSPDRSRLRRQIPSSEPHIYIYISGPLHHQLVFGRRTN